MFLPLLTFELALDDAEADGEDGHVVRHGRATDDEGSEALMLRNYVAKPNRREVDEGKVETFKRI